METRDILNYLGEVVGTLELPDNTSEEVWAEKLALYAAPPPTPVIPDVSPRQIRQALVLTGVSMAQVDTALASLEEPTRSLAQISWEYSIVFERANPLVAQVGTMLGWTDQQLDDLWLYANSL
jgi:hypothetical protein